MIVNAAATEDAATKAKQLPELGVGLHFNLTLGRPVSDIDKVRTLVDGRGCFYSRGVLARKMLLQRVSREELERELKAQFERMQSLGLNPTHIDSHQHLHAFPLCFDVVASVCESQRIPIRMPWILNLAGVRLTVAKRLKQWLLKRMLARNCKHWAARLDWNSGLGSLFDLGDVPEEITISHYKVLLQAAPGEAFELMVHPARDAGELTGLTRIGETSEREWRFLMSERLPALIAELGFTKATYRDI